MNPSELKWSELLKQAVNEPGLVSRAYSAFHGYSIGNQLLAMWQCRFRGIQPGPIATFVAWREKGRHVKKGAKAIELCMPVTCKGTKEVNGEEAEPYSYTRFIYRKNWFVLSQTEGESVPMPELAEWKKDQALAALEIAEVPFELLNGNCQGYAVKRSVAINPVCPMPWKTLFHELAHVVLGHTEEGTLTDSETTPRDIRELEAESVALLCCESLGLDGAEFSRGYIQGWYKGNEVPEKSAQKIFSAANKILEAGRGDK